MRYISALFININFKIMQKTVGGQRLGSGNKMTYHTKTFNRSTHDLSEIVRTTMAAGTLVPFMVLPALPGDTFDIDLEAEIRTLPTIGPLFGSFKLQLDIFEIPWRIYIRDMMINKIDIGRDMSKVLLPELLITSNSIGVGLNQPYTNETPWGGKELANCQIEPSTLLSYLGIKGLGNGVEGDLLVTRKFQGLTVLMYYDIVKQYYSNKQEKYGYIIHNQLLEQMALMSGIKIYTNNQEYNYTPNTHLQVEYNTQFAIVLQFSNRDYYESFQEDQLRIGTATTNANPTAFISLDYFIVQRKNDTMEIYYTQKNGTITNPATYYVTIDSKVKYGTTLPNLTPFLLSNIDEIKNQIMAHDSATPFTIGESLELSPYSLMFEGRFNDPAGVYDVTNLQCKQEGLAIKTYQSDVNNNWLDTEWIDGENGVNNVTAIHTDSEGKFTLDEFNIKKKVYDMLNHVNLSGGTFDDWQETLWNVERTRSIASPVFAGGLSKEIVFQEVVSQAAISDENNFQPLGTLAGRGRFNDKHKGGKIVIKTYEPSFIMGIASITPRVDYSQGNSWFNNLKNVGEIHNPYMDNIGFQDLITDTMAFFDSRQDENQNIIYRSAGKQPSWINYQTNVNKVFANFALESELMFMTLNRRYEGEQNGDNWEITDVTTYIDPTKFNHIFADTSPDAMNFWLQTSAKITARRLMSANPIPHI